MKNAITKRLKFNYDSVTNPLQKLQNVTVFEKKCELLLKTNRAFLILPDFSAII